MAGGKRLKYPKEEILDGETLLRRVPEHLFEEDGSGKPLPGAFTNMGGGMSTDWERHSSPEACRARAPSPDKFGVVSLNVGAIRQIEDPKQTVEHAPSKKNQSHTEVFGEKTPGVDIELVDLATVRIGRPSK